MNTVDGLIGFQSADELARDGVNQPCQGLETYFGITRKQKTSTLNEWIEKIMSKIWRNEVGYRQAKEMIAGCSPARINWRMVCP